MVFLIGVISAAVIKLKCFSVLLCCRAQEIKKEICFENEGGLKKKGGGERVGGI